MTAGRKTQPRGRGVRVLWILSLLAAPAIAGDPPPEEVWTHTLAGETYHTYDVSLGNCGTQAFCDTGVVTRYTRLYSATKGTTATPVWQASSPDNGYYRDVDSAEQTDVHVVSRQEDAGGGAKEAVLEVYTSSDSAPVWTYEFPGTFPSGEPNACRITPDGNRIVAALKGVSDIHVIVFGATSNTPLAEHFVPLFGVNMSTFEISDDATRLYAANDARAVVFDLSSGTALLEKYLIGSGDKGHSFSGDGRTLAFPKDASYRVWRDQGAGTFTEILTVAPFGATSSAHRPSHAALDDDGRTFVCTYSVVPDNLVSHVFAVDLDTGAQVLHDISTGAGSYQNIPSCVALTADGTRLAVGLWGDQMGQAPEILVYQRDAAGEAFDALTSFDLAGSVYAMDISENGDHLVTCGRDSHANVFVGNKVVEAFDLGADLQLRGLAQIGGTISFDYYPETSTRAYLLVAPSLASPPQVFQAGTLYLERSSLDFLWMESVGGGRMSLLDYPIPATLDAGETFYVQGFGLGLSRELSDSWIPVTVLP